MLSPEHRIGSGKARFFIQLGFNQSEWPVLQRELKRFASAEADLGPTTEFGQKYVVAGSILGPAGRRAEVVVVWIVLAGEDLPRLVTAYPGAKA